jgi:prepilin-type N-terminal cleavage/methylation domain-containing protein
MESHDMPTAIELESRVAHREAGFTLSELLIVIAIIGIVSAIANGEFLRYLERAKLAACMAQMRVIQRTVFQYSDVGSTFIAESDLWNTAWQGQPPGPYAYLRDNEDPNNGHGNDLDGFDEGNPGNAPRTGKDIDFVVLCQHNHGRLAKYVYIEDEGPPQCATSSSEPNYERFLHMGGGGGNGGTGGGGTGGGGNGGGGNGGGNGGGKP